MFRFPLNVRRWLPCVGVLAAMLYLSENNSACASCGDYLAHSGNQVHTEEFPVRGEHQSDRGPCRGPHCHSAPSAPMMPAPFRMDFSRVDHLLIDLFHAGLQGGSSGYLVFSGVIELPLPSASRLERPPRSGF